MALAMQAHAQPAPSPQPSYASGPHLPPLDADVPRRASITDPLLHAHVSLPGSADGARRDSHSHEPVGFGAGAAFTAGHQASMSEPGRPGSPDGRHLSSRDRAPSVPNQLGQTPLSPVSYSAAPNYALSYGWPQQQQQSSPYMGGLKRKSIGDEAYDGSDFKRRSSVDGARIGALSLEAEEERRRSSTSTTWSSSGSSAYHWQPNNGRVAYPGPGSDPRQVPSAIADQLASYTFGQPPSGALPGQTRFLPSGSMPTGNTSALSPTSASRMLGGMALATLAQGQAPGGVSSPLPPDHRRSLPTQGSTFGDVAPMPPTSLRHSIAGLRDDEASNAGDDASSQRSGSGGPRHPSITAIKETPYSRSPELRVSHKLAERKRRKEMKELFDELRDSLPVERGTKNSKWEILAKASEFIAGLKAHNAELSSENDLLRSHVTALSAAAANGQNLSGAAAASAALALGPRPVLGGHARPSAGDSRRASYADEVDATRSEMDRTPMAAPSGPWPGHQQYPQPQPQPFYQDPGAPQHPARPPAVEQRHVNGRSRRPSAMQTSGSEEELADSRARPSPNGSR